MSLSDLCGFLVALGFLVWFWFGFVLAFCVA